VREAFIACEMRLPIESDTDIVAVRQNGDELAGECGFPSTDRVVVATAISELARNIVRYAARGEITLRLVDDCGRRGVEVRADDDGPGIPDVALAMRDGFSTSGSFGLGLPGVRRLMDEFEISSEFGKGTRVTARKWTWVSWGPPELDDWFGRFGRAWARGITTRSNLQTARALGLIVALAETLSDWGQDADRGPRFAHRLRSPSRT
jgi:serine/threonine-protein kinase RsbT